MNTLSRVLPNFTTPALWYSTQISNQKNLGRSMMSFATQALHHSRQIPTPTNLIGRNLRSYVHSQNAQHLMTKRITGSHEESSIYENHSRLLMLLIGASLIYKNDTECSLSKRKITLNKEKVVTKQSTGAQEPQIKGEAIVHIDAKKIEINLALSGSEAKKRVIFIARGEDNESFLFCTKQDIAPGKNCRIIDLKNESLDLSEIESIETKIEETDSDKNSEKTALFDTEDSSKQALSDGEKGDAIFIGGIITKKMYDRFAKNTSKMDLDQTIAWLANGQLGQITLKGSATLTSYLWDIKPAKIKLDFKLNVTSNNTVKVTFVGLETLTKEQKTKQNIFQPTLWTKNESYSSGHFTEYVLEENLLEGRLNETEEVSVIIQSSIPINAEKNTYDDSKIEEDDPRYPLACGISYTAALIMVAQAISGSARR